MKNIFFALCALFLFSACKEKKIIVFSKGKAVVDTDKKTIKATDGGSNEETPVSLTTGSATYQVSSPAGEGKIDLPETGLYIINAKNDTIIGGYQHYGDPKDAQRMITQVELKHRIDSVISLSEGKASAANRTFFILPNTAVKITDNTAADVVGPYHRMRSAAKIDGKDPEIYHFYSIKEIREKIEEMKALTISNR